MDNVPSQRVVLARHTTDNGEIQLQQRPQADGSLAYEIIADGVFLMASYNQVSARALTRLALDLIPGGSRPDLRVLVGGLGMGFTLQEALRDDVTAVDVVESSPQIVEWNHAYFTGLNDNAINDPRVRLIEDDLFHVLSVSAPASYDAILLDVDNGPSWLAHEDNARLYTREALAQWSEMLTPAGIFAVWSAQPEPAFLRRLQAVFCDGEEIIVKENDHKNAPVAYFIYRGIAPEM